MDSIQPVMRIIFLILDLLRSFFLFFFLHLILYQFMHNNKVKKHNEKQIT